MSNVVMQDYLDALIAPAAAGTMTFQLVPATQSAVQDHGNVCIAATGEVLMAELMNIRVKDVAR